MTGKRGALLGAIVLAGVVLIQRAGASATTTGFARDLDKLVHEYGTIGDRKFRDKLVFTAQARGIELEGEDIEVSRDEPSGLLQVEVRYVVERWTLFWSTEEEVVTRATTADTGES